MHLKNIIIQFLFLFFSTTFFAQNQITIDAIVLDKETNQPIAYVNIGFKEKGIGTISNEEGEFFLTYDKSQIDKNDILIFSVLGFESIEIKASDLFPLLSNANKIYLKPKTYIIDEIEITSEKREEKRIGNSGSNTESIAYWKDKKSFGGEIATKIRIKKNDTKLLDLKFTIIENISDSLKMRVNVYNYVNGYPGENLLKTKIYHTITKKEGEEIIDLKPYNIHVNKDIIIGLELVEVYGEKIGFVVSADRDLGVSLTKYTSQDKWERYFGISMNFSLLTSYPLGKKEILVAREKPTRISLYWDTSLSMKDRILDKELEFLSSYFKKNKSVEIEVIKFSNTASVPKKFNISKGKNKDLSSYLSDTNYDGVTNYSQILKSNDFNADIILLFTDGNENFTSLEPEIFIPIFTINTLKDANHFVLQETAIYVNGHYINLNKISPKTALELILNEVNDKTVYTDNNNSISKQSIYGKVSSKVGPLLGATVNIKNTFIETQTNAAGIYRLDAKKGDILRVNYFGMKEKEIFVADTKNINIDLESEILNEVVSKRKANRKAGRKNNSLAKKNDNNKIIPTVGGLETTPVYITALEKSSSYQEALVIYKQQKEETNQLGVLFYLKSSQYFMKWDIDFSYTILSSIAELAFNNSKALKTLAFKYENLEKLEEAKLIYQRLVELQPEDAQSYRDLALIYAETNNYTKAMNLYKQMLNNSIGNIDFSSLLETIENEIKHLLKANFKYDLRIVFEWNYPYSEFELEIVGPKKKYFKWSHSKTDNTEQLYDEIKNGYYTKEYVIENVDPGEWMINIKTLNKDSPLNPSYLKYTVYKNYGLPNETKEIKLINLDQQQNVILDKFLYSY